MIFPFVDTLALLALGGPAFAFVLLAAWLVSPLQVPERRIHQALAWTFSTSLAVVLVLLVARLAGVIEVPELDLGPLFALRGYDFHLHFRLDGPALFFVALDYALCGLIAAFSSRYLHQDPGFHRFYLLLLLFSMGVAAIATAAGLDLLFAGWELVGLTSALLIAYFNRREGPSRHGLRAYAVYRVTDIGLLAALVAVHHVVGSVSFTAIAAGSPELLLLPAAFIVLGAMGKGAMVPFTGWLPRAMEGPTPSSAIFYGALSIHASPFLLLRIQSTLESLPALQIAVFAIGATTLLHAAMVGRVQTDIKTSLGYASVAQVGLMWMEVALGWTTLAWIHLGGHALLRTWQLLRAPSLLHDRHHLARVYGASVAPSGKGLASALPKPLAARLYRLSMERWYLDELLTRALRVLLAPARMLDRLDESLAHRVEDGPEVEASVVPAQREALL